MDRFRLQPIASRIGAVLLIVSLVVLLGLWLRLSLERFYAIDEFAYAHGAWLVAHGQIPAVDFFETKFLGPLWIFATAFLIGGDNPHLILALRVLVWPFVAVVAFAAARLNRRFHPLAPLATLLLLVANPVFMNSALEIRPDIVALAFLALALVLVDQDDAHRGRAVALGLVLGACLWSSAKAGVYASPFALVWLFDLSRRGRGRALAFDAPWTTLLGGLVVVVGVLGYLAMTGSAMAFYENAIQHNQKFLVGERWRPWQTDVMSLVRTVPWIHVLALTGVASDLLRLVRRRAPIRGIDVLLLALVPSTFASYALQLYPFVYSLLPFMLVEAIFAGRGLVFLCAWAGLSNEVGEGDAVRDVRLLWAARVLFGVIVAWMGIGVLQSGLILYGVGAPTNDAQHELLTLIDRVSEPGDPIYDNSGSYVARPNAYFLPWTDEPIRRLWADKLIREVPAAIEASHCVVAVVDPRFPSLPEPLREYLHAHFKPYAGPVLMWGRDFTSPTGHVDSEFVANRTGVYRVLPEEIAREGGLVVGASPIAEPFFTLEKGAHPVRYDGPRGGFRLQWAPPRDAGAG